MLLQKVAAFNCLLRQIWIRRSHAKLKFGKRLLFKQNFYWCILITQKTNLPCIRLFSRHPCNHCSPLFTGPVGLELQNTLTASLQRGKTPPTSVLDIIENNLMMRLQYCWSFRECRVTIHCHRSPVHFWPEWLHLIGTFNRAQVEL